ncbi:MAG: hypothetical protein JXR78_01715 [Victivallales bacterium]|nr:hypothetical protein [Victivallales bacterium]
MRNINADSLVSVCNSEIQKIRHFKETNGSTNTMMASLTKYSVIKCCGTIEQCFKTIITDSFNGCLPQQAERYIEKVFRNSSMNPSFDNIMQTLKQFDEVWASQFKNAINGLSNKDIIKASLKSLNENRNKFAHGESVDISFDAVVSSYNHSLQIIEMLDNVIG